MMKKFILLFFLLSGLFLHIDAQTISEGEAKDYARQWFNYIEGKKDGKLNMNKIEKMENKETDSTFIYGVNFEGGGFVLISSEQGINPVLGYSRTGTFDEANLSLGEKRWIECVIDHLKLVKEKNKRVGNTVKFDMASNIKNISLQSSSTPTSAPSLFQTYQTSKWAYFGPYTDATPFEGNANVCAPLAMAQIVKYYQYPMQGTGSYGGIDFSRQFYDYSEMPYRLTYCNYNPDSGICGDASYSIIPGVTAYQIKNVSTLIYHCGVMVDTQLSGTLNSYPSDWVGKLVQYFNYSPSFNNRSYTYIANNNSAFKEELRNEILNKRPVLFAYYDPAMRGHVVVIDGYENNDYFHFVLGIGGNEDLYYYLFDLDNDGVHPVTPKTSYYCAATGIQPNCPNVSDQTINNVSFSDSRKYEATNSVVANTVTVLSGGRIAIQAGNFIQLNSDFEIQSGAECIFEVKACGAP